MNTRRRGIAPPKLENSILIEVPKELSDPHVVLYRALRDSVAGYKPEYTKCICQHTKRSNWIVMINREFDASFLFGKKLSYDKYTLDIQDPNVSRNLYVCTLRLHWLSPDTTIDEITRFIRANVHLEDIYVDRERYRGEELKDVENGVYRVKIKTTKLERERVDRLIGKKELSDQRTLITRIGDPIMCYFCEAYGHTQADCETKKIKGNLKCSKCLRRGHTTEECSIAKRTATYNAFEQDENGILNDVYDANRQDSKELQNVSQHLVNVVAQTSASQANVSLINDSQTNVSQANVSQATVSQANVSQATVSQANVSQATVSQANVSQANVSQANASQVSVSQASASQLSVSQASVSQANVSQANASQVSVSQASASQLSVSQASVSQANAEQANATVHTNLHLTTINVQPTSQHEQEADSKIDPESLEDSESKKRKNRSINSTPGNNKKINSDLTDEEEDLEDEAELDSINNSNETMETDSEKIMSKPAEAAAQNANNNQKETDKVKNDSSSLRPVKGDAAPVGASVTKNKTSLTTKPESSSQKPPPKKEENFSRTTRSQSHSSHERLSTVYSKNIRS
jgi:uncharacterized protein YjbI with pentapeptide repeats